MYRSTPREEKEDHVDFCFLVGQTSVGSELLGVWPMMVMVLAILKTSWGSLLRGFSFRGIESFLQYTVNDTLNISTGRGKMADVFLHAGQETKTGRDPWRQSNGRADCPCDIELD